VSRWLTDHCCIIVFHKIVSIFGNITSDICFAIKLKFITSAQQYWFYSGFNLSAYSFMKMTVLIDKCISPTTVAPYAQCNPCMKFVANVVGFSRSYE